jgi:prepilin-type N-terminal cleavage/methylation domain-containing protein
MIHSRSHRRAFTLIELLVVIGIIALLAGILLPLIVRSLRRAKVLRTQADFQTISIALDAYKQDFGDYPRPPVQSSSDPTPGQPFANTGAAILGKALLGPYGDGQLPNNAGTDTQDPPVWQSSVPYHPGDCVSDGGGKYYVTMEENTGQSVSTPDYYALFNPLDGADGPGFRTRATPTGGPAMGKVWGPYLAPGKIKNEGVYLLDLFGGPILYFVARPAVPNLSPNPTPPVGASGTSPYVDLPSTASTSILALYNAYDNLQAFRRQFASEEPPGGGNDTPALNRIRITFGDNNTNGAIDPGETAVTLPFVLISAGNDNFFGPTTLFNSTTNKDDFSDPVANQKAIQKCDDVTNFQ